MRFSKFDSLRVSRPCASLPRVSLFLVAVLSSPLAALPVEAPSRPNLVFILADDLGWSDTTLFGTTSFYRTPHVERLAARGMTFTRAYASSPLCSPTRASILTGRSPARTGITSPTCHLPRVLLSATPGAAAAPHQKVISPESATRLDTRHHTLAETLRDRGYATAHFGKWHLGAEPFSPLEHGFDVDVPHWPGPGPAGSYVAPWKFPDFDPNVPDEHIEDRMAAEAVAFLEKHRDEPFFLNYWMFSVHAPFDAKPGTIARYRERVDPASPQRSPTYAAMIESMDDAVGTLLDALDRLKIADRTLIVFASDNGGNTYSEVDGTTATSNAPLRGGKATMYEGGIRGPAIVAYPGEIEAGSRSDEVIQSIDFYPTILELLGIDSRPEPSFDGISIVPALRGGALESRAIFTYFPHGPKVPDWLPPSVSVHRDGWKLIRMFHGGVDGAHRHLLFHLDDDPGERSDVAGRFPDRVKQLDALIESHLRETGAVVPVPNPRFDPARYDPELEGRAALKRSATARPAKRSPPRASVAGWQPGGTCELSLAGGALVVKSGGRDPYLSFRLPDAISGSALELRFTMASNSAGAGQVFWQEAAVAPPFHRQRSRSVEILHDGEPHDYSVPIPAKEPVVAVRIDPSTAGGTMRLLGAALIDDKGEVRWRWSPPASVEKSSSDG